MAVAGASQDRSDVRLRSETEVAVGAGLESGSQPLTKRLLPLSMRMSSDTEYCSNGCKGVFACNPRLLGILRLSYSLTVIDTGGSGLSEADML